MDADSTNVVYRFAMKTNTAKTALILAAAIAFSTATPSIAATYPPTINKITLNTSLVVVGSSTVTVKTVLTLTKTSTATTIKANTPIRVLVKGIKSGAVVHSTLKAPNGKVTVLPDIVANSKGVIDVKALALKVPGKYSLYYWLPNGTYKLLTITVKK